MTLGNKGLHLLNIFNNKQTNRIWHPILISKDTILAQIPKELVHGYTVNVEVHYKVISTTTYWVWNLFLYRVYL